jgi:zinc transport system substrate-binding protein
VRSTPNVAAAIVVAGLLAGCAGSDDNDPNSDGAPIEVVASFYPLAWVAEEIGGDAVDVQNLTPAGSEPHDLELSPSQTAAVAEADLVVAMGSGFQPSLEAAAEARKNGTLFVLASFLDAHADPHVWLNPVQMIEIVDTIERSLVEIATEERDAFATRADDLRAELSALDDEYTSGLADCARRDLFTSHEAFGWLARRYDLRQQGVAGISPDEEPSPGRLAELAEMVRDSGATTIFAETLLSPEIAETLADEAGGIRVATLNPIEGLTDEQADSGADYLSVMRDNLRALRDALGCT